MSVLNELLRLCAVTSEVTASNDPIEAIVFKTAKDRNRFANAIGRELGVSSVPEQQTGLCFVRGIELKIKETPPCK